MDALSLTARMLVVHRALQVQGLRREHCRTRCYPTPADDRWIPVELSDEPVPARLNEEGGVVRGKTD